MIASSSLSSLSSKTWKYDVFLSFKGEDTRKTFVDHLYHALANRVNRIYKDDVTLERGYTIGPSLLNAIQESQIALVIFSEYYAYSSWCLDELAYIMKCREEMGQIVIPIFYNVDPSDVRELKGQFGKAFAKHKLANNHKVESWRKALFDASNIAGWEPNQIAKGHEAAGIKEIVGAILDKLLYENLVVLKIHHSLQKEFWKGCKHLPCLKELEVNNARHLVRMPDFGGLPCLQKLTLHRCDSLKNIDPSLGNHSRLAYICVSSCDKLTRFPTIVWMEKLETLAISDCYSLREFPGIEANMNSLVNLRLNNVGIRVIPSSVGRCCTNLISLHLKNCTKLKCIEGNFLALKHLQKFELDGFTKLEWLPKDLFDEKCRLEELCFNLKYSWGFNGLLRSPPHFPRLLGKLNLSGFELEDGEIPCEIGELSDLQELHLCRNRFSRLDFSLFQLTRLKRLNLSGCYNLVELPELPSNLSILQADECDSLEAIKDDVHRNCKWLCQVSISKSYGLCSFVGGERLLETMIQGKAQCMIMELKGLEIPKRFEPRLVRGNRCRLKLPENWFNEFSGILFCCVWKKSSSIDSVKITMRHEEKRQLQIGMGDSQDEQVFWGESSFILHTWMGYVSFGSLRCTTWWDKTSTATAIEVSIDLGNTFGARLVSKKNQMEETTTITNNSSADDDYKCKFNILCDSRSFFKCEFEPHLRPPSG